VGGREKGENNCLVVSARFSSLFIFSTWRREQGRRFGWGDRLYKANGSKPNACMWLHCSFPWNWKPAFPLGTWWTDRSLEREISRGNMASHLLHLNAMKRSILLRTHSGIGNTDFHLHWTSNSILRTNLWREALSLYLKAGHSLLNAASASADMRGRQYSTLSRKQRCHGKRTNVEFLF